MSGRTATGAAVAEIGGGTISAATRVAEPPLLSR
jgi:hypothetical protein